ncbi:MAG: DUF2194 domain-containing protein [Flavobacterium sp.]|uniref:DUF2194 domain-containing protein n=1 Tax=Flavobacterium sp. TaxID=239 RepID=UPI003527D449
MITSKINLNKSILFIVFLLIATSCGKLENLSNSGEFNFFNSDEDGRVLRRYTNIGPNNPTLIQFVLDNNNVECSKAYNNLKKTCEYTKISLKSIPLKQWNLSPQISETTRVLCLFDTKSINSSTIDAITMFVAKGGTLFLPFNSEDKRFNFLIGLNPESHLEIDITSSGYNFKIPVLPNYANKKFERDLIFYGYKRSNFKQNIKVLSTAANNDTYPLITENNIGNGKVIFYNLSTSLEKMDRGLAFSAILKGLEGVPYPIANVSVIHLDDFPSPVYDIYEEPVKSEFNQNIAQYVQKTWWPDMLKLADEYDLKYTALTAFDYNNNIQPPFLFSQWDSYKATINKRTEIVSDWLAKDVLNKGHELGFHGYNHVSLLQNEWKNAEFTRLALNSAEKKWKINGYGNLPVTYVPPSNDIDKFGLIQLSKGMPSVKFMCSTYTGEFQEGGNREFDFEPLEPNLFDFPRTSSGFYLKEKDDYSLNSTYLITGIWSHFVHPDDIFQIPNANNKSQGNYGLRNSDGLGWHTTPGSKRAMFPLFKNLIAEMKLRYPQMRFVKAADGGYLVNDWRASKFIHKSNNGIYSVEETKNDESLTQKQYWFLYGSYENQKRIENQLKNDNAVYKKTPFLEGYLYSVYTDEPRINSIDLGYKSADALASLYLVEQSVKNEYKAYLQRVIDFQKEEIYVDTSEEDHRKEVEALRLKMISTPEIDKTTWNKYTTFLTWEERGNEVWDMLDEHIKKYSSKNNIMYSAELNRIVDYRSETEREKWLRMQFQADPTNKSVLVDYIASYNSPEYKEYIKQALDYLLKIDNSKEAKILYLDYLLNYEPNNALLLLENIEPSSEYENIATAITWLYADNNDFKKAIEWSVFANEIDFYTKMTWYIEAKDYETLVLEYTKYITTNPNDNKVNALMSSTYHEMGKFKNSWVIADDLPNDFEEKEVLRAMLNKDVEYENRELIDDLIKNHKALFYPETLERLQKNQRKEFGNYLNLVSGLETNQEKNSSVKNVVSYNVYDKKMNLHSIGGTFSRMYKLDFDISDVNDNITQDIVGIEYRFTRAVKENKINYWSGSRIEYSNQSSLFFHFKAGAILNKLKNYKSLELKIAPAESGAAYSKNIYRFQMNYYQDIFFLRYLNATISLEGNFYNSSKTKETQYFTKETYEGSGTVKLFYDEGKDQNFKILPFVESSYSQGSIKGDFRELLRTGYPYWMIDNRFYYGGGLGFKIGKESNNFNLRVEGSYFKDDFSDNFQRFNGVANYLLFDYTEINVNFELFVQSLYYSNAIQVGIKHSLKKRNKK